MEIISALDGLFSATTPSLAQFESLAGGALGRRIDAFSEKDYSTADREFRRSMALSPYSDNARNAFESMATTQVKSEKVKSGKTSDAVTTYQQTIRSSRSMTDST